MKHELFQPDAELLDALVAEPSASLLRSFFRSRVTRAETAFIYDECFTFGLFDDLTDDLSPSAAFSLLASAPDIASTESASARFACALALVASLAQHSDTTEEPSRLHQVWPDFAARVAALSPTHDAVHQFHQIKNWHRIQ